MGTAGQPDGVLSDLAVRVCVMSSELAGRGDREGLAALRAASDEWTRRLMEATNRAVATARLQGASWADIGRELGITKQSAHQRFRWLEAGGFRLLRAVDGGEAWFELVALPGERLDPRRQSAEVAWQAMREIA